MVTIKTTFYSTQKYIVQEALFSILALHISSYLESFIYIVDRSITYMFSYCSANIYFSNKNYFKLPCLSRKIDVFWLYLLML